MSAEEKVKAIHAKIAATRGLVPEEQIERMHVLWKKGHNMFTSFFTEVSAVRQRIGNEELFASWCFFQLGIGAIRLSEMATVLRAEDASRVGDDLAAAKRAEKERLAEEVHARKLAKIKRDNELAAERVQNAEYRANKVKQEQRAKTERTRADTKRRRAEKAVKAGDAVTRAKAAWLANPNARRDDICRIADVDHAAATHARAALEEAGKLAPKPKKDASGYEGCRHIEPGQEELYEQYVIEGRKAAGYQWILGDLAIKVCALKIYGGAILERYARDIDVEHATLKNYRAIAKAWPEKDRRPSFSVGDALRTHPNRTAIVTNDPHMTCEEAREIMRAHRAMSNHER